MDITIAIPTYNGGSRYLSQVLDALRKQVNVSKISWEVIVVDTKELVRKVFY